MSDYEIAFTYPPPAPGEERACQVCGSVRVVGAFDRETNRSTCTPCVDTAREIERKL